MRGNLVTSCLKKNNMEHIIRVIAMVMFLSTAVTSQSCTSPTSSCDCFQIDGKAIINCRYKNLTAIPTFTNTNQVYDEIRFTSVQETGTCQPYLGCNNIQQIGANAFANLKVKKIDLLNNPVTSIDINAFVGLEPEIESISLEGDGSNGMPFQALAALDEYLKNLHLENYGDSSIATPIVFPFPNLESLTIKKWRNLHSIEPGVFSVMTNLKKLNLISLKDLTILPVPAIQKFLKLENIDIMDTGIRSVLGDSFTPMALLKDIKIRNNINLNTIDQRAFSGVTDSVEFLEIDNNNLNDKLSLEFLRNENWTVLNHLNIGYNFNLKDIPSEIFSKTPALAYVQCQDIGLTSINKDMFFGLRSLHTLDLAYNNIRTVTAQTFQNSPTLVELRLHDQSINNNLLDIQNDAFHGIETSLEMLSLYNNKLNVSQFWNDLSKLTNLLVLEVKNTGLQEIPARAFRNNIKLTDLSMADNNITFLNQESFFGPRDTLQTIDMRGNKIQSVDQCTLNDFPSRPQLTLAGNQLNCNCDLAWLYDWFKLQNDQDTVARQDIGKCASPDSLKDKYFTEFSKSQMCPNGATIKTCPNLYLTTTTTTTTTSTTTTTTPVPTTPPMPEFGIRINNRAATYIEVAWVILDETYLDGVKLEMISNYQGKKIAYLGRDAKSHTFYQLREDTTYTFCLILKIEDDYRDADQKCQSTTTLPSITDPPSSTTTGAPESSSQLGVIVGTSVGGVVLVILVIAILVILLRYNKPKKPLTEPVSFTMKADVPHAGGTARRFAKKVEKEGASPDDISVTVISNGDMNHPGRISAGSYQALNEKGVDSRPMPSSYGHYTNSVEDRPLPKAPTGATGHGYVNTGFKNSRDHLPETSKNDYSEVRY